MNRNLSERQCMKRHYLQLELMCKGLEVEEKSGGSIYEGLRLHHEDNGEPPEVSEKRDVIKHMIK